jgi:hypothetical protein
LRRVSREYSSTIREGSVDYAGEGCISSIVGSGVAFLALDEAGCGGMREGGDEAAGAEAPPTGEDIQTGDGLGKRILSINGRRVGWTRTLESMK